MIDAPEKIWIEQDDCPYFYEESELAEVGSPVTEYIRADLCPRPAPAAPVEGLERYMPEPMSLGGMVRDTDGGYVTRSQAEAIIAAERAKVQHWQEQYTEMHSQFIDLAKSAEADNAALTARVKELEQINANLMGDDEDKPRYTTKRLKLEIARATEALKAKLAAAEKALEPFADHANDRAVDDTGWRDKETVKIVVSIGDLRKARAVLGGKPS